MAEAATPARLTPDEEAAIRPVLRAVRDRRVGLAEGFRQLFAAGRAFERDDTAKRLAKAAMERMHGEEAET